MSRLLFISAILGWFAPCVAQADPTTTVLDLSDLGVSLGGVHMPENYDGFRWLTSDWHYLSVVSQPENVFLALSGTATTIVAKGGVDFYFDGADYWSRRGADANGRFYFILHHDGVLVYDGREDPDGWCVFTGTPQRFVPNYTGPVDVVAVVFDQGGDDWDHLAMDNFSFHGLGGTEAPTEPMIARQGEALALGFKGTAGQPYRIDTSADLASGGWTQLAVVTADDAGAITFTDTTPLLISRFFRAAAP